MDGLSSVRSGLHHPASSPLPSPRKNPNIATGDSPPKEVGDKSSATFVSVVRRTRRRKSMRRSRGRRRGKRLRRRRV
jgi:hypothetical protein